MQSNQLSARLSPRCEVFLSFESGAVSPIIIVVHVLYVSLNCLYVSLNRMQLARKAAHRVVTLESRPSRLLLKVGVLCG
jgi:hypothetical protein